VLGGGVFHDVRQRFLNDAVQRRLELGRQAFPEVRLDGRADAAPLAEGLRKPLDCDVLLAVAAELVGR